MTSDLDTGRVFSEARVSCVNLDDDGDTMVVATHKNLGWHQGRQGYVSEFIVDGVSRYALFASTKHHDDVCPDPMQRLSFDKEFLEEYLGLMLVDVEPVSAA